jgi:beta-mannosidase
VTRRTVDLGGADWNFGSVPTRPLESQADDRHLVAEWLPATVPGNVRTDLLALGRILDPFYSTQNDENQWVDGLDWWYTRPLEVNLGRAERAFLRFEGIDYISAVYFDGTELGRHEGMFSRQTYEITNPVMTGRSEVAVRIWGSDALPQRRLSWWERLWSPLATALQGGREAFPQRSATLKCQMSFGWDFAPRLRTMGLWDEVALVTTGSVFVSDVFVRTLPGDEGANVTVRATIDSDAHRDVTAVIQVGPRDEGEAETQQWQFGLTLRRGHQAPEMRLTLLNPRLWQPWDRGEPCLYDLELRILHQGQVLDSVAETFGVRSVETAPNPRAPRGSEEWTLVVNGSREFIRGANWVPPDSLPGRVRREEYETVVAMAKEAGINLLRVWGGGLREKRAFYDLCDEQGMMVWQEFPLACLLLGHLPRSTTFRDLLRREATSIVRQLRNHPSLVTWCGGNEISYRRNRGLLNMLEEQVRAEDGTRPFRKTSPGRGNSHNWLVWHGKAPITEYQKDLSPFVSEFGLQSIPHVSSLSRFLPGDELFPPRHAWRYHCAQLEKLQRYVSPMSPDTLERLIEASQKVQALGLQLAIEHFRRRKYHTSGCMIWQLNDPWPAISWSIIDYYRQPKLAWERLKSIYNPILVSLEYPPRVYRAGDHFRARVWCINDLISPCSQSRLEVQLDGRAVFSQTVSLPPDSCQQVAWLELAFDEDPGVLAMSLREGDRVISSNEYDLTYHDPRRAGVLDVLNSRIVQWLRE